MRLAQFHAKARVAPGVLFQYAAALVGRSVVEHNYFARPDRLREHRVQRPWEMSGVIAIRDDNRQFSNGHRNQAAGFRASMWAFMVLMLK